MYQPIGLLAIIIGAFGAYYSADAVQAAPTPFSTYGNIQNVQNYSSNPFWTPNSPYNQRFPKAIYATGPDVETGDCNRIVENLITSYCLSNDCSNLRIKDVRPDIMLQLSQLPGHNFATSCGGYIDGIFEKYQKEHGNTSTVIIKKPTSQIKTTTFPTTTQKPTNVTAERTAELEQLQKITTPTPKLVATDFPRTTADLSFTERLANTAAGYKPYEDLSPYRIPEFEDESTYWARMKSQNKPLYCTEFPDDKICDEIYMHKIEYKAFDGDTSDCPQTYKTGAGATIDCVPTRDKKSQFIGWCTDAGLKDCAPTQTIAPTEDTDKTFWAKWQCIGSSTEINHKCVCTDSNMDDTCQCSGKFKPAPSDSTKCVCVNGKRVDYKCEDNPPPPTVSQKCPNIVDHRDPNTCECYPSDFMNSSDCSCRGMSEWDGSAHKCVCPISTSNLDISSWSYVTTMCKCPSDKPNYDPTTHLCEAGTTPPTNNGETYAILSCHVRPSRLQDSIYLGTGKAMKNPASSLQCKIRDMTNNTEDANCFLHCGSSNGTGFLNSIIKPIINKDICVGRKIPNGTNEEFYVAEFQTGKIQPILLDNIKIDQIKKAINNNLSKTPSYCKSSSRYWRLYILQRISSTEWIAVDAITLN